MAITVKENLFIPQVVGDLIATNYGKFITVSNYVPTDRNLVAKPGDTLTRNQYTYIGDAEVLDEAADATPVVLTSKTIEVKVEKIVKQVQLSDEAILSAADDPYGQAAEQIAMAIALKDDADCITALSGATLTGSGSSLATGIIAGLKALGEKALKQNVYVFCNSGDYFDMISDFNNWIPASQLAAEKVTAGVVGQYAGALVIPTDTVEAGKPYLMIEGALRKEMKKDFLVENARNLTNYTNLISGAEHRVIYLADTTKAVAVTVA